MSRSLPKFDFIDKFVYCPRDGRSSQSQNIKSNLSKWVANCNIYKVLQYIYIYIILLLLLLLLFILILSYPGWRLGFVITSIFTSGFRSWLIYKTCGSNKLWKVFSITKWADIFLAISTLRPLSNLLIAPIGDTHDARGLFVS